MTTSPTPSIYTDLRFTVDGPHSQVEQFRKWFKESFAAWSKPFRPSNGYHLNGLARRERGALWVSIGMRGSAHDMIAKLAELIEQDFAGLCISGTACERSSWDFSNIKNIVAGKVEIGPFVESFGDADEQDWRGGPGAYELVPGRDYDDFEDELSPQADTSASPKLLAG